MNSGAKFLASDNDEMAISDGKTSILDSYEIKEAAPNEDDSETSTRIYGAIEIKTGTGDVIFLESEIEILDK